MSEDKENSEPKVSKPHPRDHALLADARSDIPRDFILKALADHPAKQRQAQAEFKQAQASRKWVRFCAAAFVVIVGALIVAWLWWR